MYSVFSTYLLYNLILFICPLLCYFGKKNKVFVYLAYFVIAIVSAFRYDIGADYETYAEGIDQIAQWLNNDYSLLDIVAVYEKEPGILLLTAFFAWSEYPYLWFIGVISIFNTVLLYKVLSYYRIHTWGLLIYVLTFTMFQGWDWVRQSVALHVFLFSLRYIESRNLRYYICCILFSTLFHYSSLCLFPLYFVYCIKISKRLLLFFSVGIFFFAVSGGFNNVYRLLELVMVLYSEGYDGSDHIYAGANTYQTPTYIFTMLWYISLLALYPQKENNQILLFYFLGVILYAMAGGNLLLVRIAYYFSSVQIVLFPFILHEYKIKSIQNTLIILILIGQFAVFNRVYIGGNFRGCTPYETIFSKNCIDKQFRYRDY